MSAADHTGSQMEFHQKPKGWPLCPTCGCIVRAGVWHRATGATENARHPYVKRIKVCFGLDTTEIGIDFNGKARG